MNSDSDSLADALDALFLFPELKIQSRWWLFISEPEPEQRAGTNVTTALWPRFRGHRVELGGDTT